MICNVAGSALTSQILKSLNAVKPLYKKGLKTELSNYHPISLLPSFSKIIEKFIYKRVYYYLEENHILDNEQFGFHENTSTDEAI
jgi:hypothetical protein